VKITDVRKIFLKKQEFFTGEIENVEALKVAVLGTDSAIGKRTTTIMLTETLKDLGYKAVFVGTGQTAWMQGAEYVALIDAMINDFVAGGIESEVVRAWKEQHPDFILIEGQGGILHPAYPGGFEIIAAGRPEAIILQHAPKRIYYDGFEKYPIPDVKRFMEIIELLSGHPIAGISLNTERMNEYEVHFYINEYERKYGVPVDAPLYTGVNKLARTLIDMLSKEKVNVYARGGY
ncbi:MAG: NAD-dependent epimerase/dehydratase family protein, partial [Thermoplasmata archaeon]